MTKWSSVEKRVRMSRLVEKINKQEAYSRKLGITDVSSFRGKKVKDKEI